MRLSCKTLRALHSEGVPCEQPKRTSMIINGNAVSNHSCLAARAGKFNNHPIRKQGHAEVNINNRDEANSCYLFTYVSYTLRNLQTELDYDIMRTEMRGKDQSSDTELYTNSI